MSLAAWQQSRSPKLADALDAQGPDKAWLRIEKLPGSRAKTAILALSKSVDDPRLATLYVRWLAQATWPAPTAKVVWSRIFDHLAALRDVRAVAPLREIAANLPSFVGAAHRAWLISRIEETAKTLAAVTPTKDRAHAPAKIVRPVAADPCAAVWAAPADLELRRVVADALTERGDPQGEFITLQSLTTTTPAQRTRTRELLSKHAATWLGPIGKLSMKGSSIFEAGFPNAVAVDRRGVHRRDWEVALAAPQWATIRRLCVSILQTPHWWITAWVAAPSTTHVLAFEVGEVDRKKPSLRIEREPGTPWRVSHAVRGYASSGTAILRAFVAGLTKAERAAFTIAPSANDRDKYLAVL